MANLDLVGIDLAKNVFQLHGCSSTGEVIFRKQVKRNKLLSFISELPKCIIAMEACSGSHYWGREFEALGHLVRLIAPKYVKPFVKRSADSTCQSNVHCVQHSDSAHKHGKKCVFGVFLIYATYARNALS